MLQAIDLSEYYGKSKALNTLNLKVNDGEIYCLLGANDAGKTTTINLFLNFIKQSSRNELVNNINVANQESKNHLAYIPEKEHFPNNIISSKGLFWIASRPNKALSWGQAGGSLRADNAGTWWCTMPFGERISYADFVNNKDLIEANWHATFGDRKKEIVFIGQDIDQGFDYSCIRSMSCK
ncbi:MAG: energy-coupling factor transporter ATP-binding protein EcfA2 [Saprospiraceae bacterium]|jgi:energy-coupling factor transporter ATP-binding protein EcfA2